MLTPRGQPWFAGILIGSAPVKRNLDPKLATPTNLPFAHDLKWVELQWNWIEA